MERGIAFVIKKSLVINNKKKKKVNFIDNLKKRQYILFFFKINVESEKGETEKYLEKNKLKKLKINLQLNLKIIIFLTARLIITYRFPLTCTHENDKEL